jgi:hypothetical protein
MKDKERENGGLTDENGATDKSAVTDSSDKDAKGNRLDKKKLFYLFSTVGLSAFFCVFYYCSMEISSRSIELYYFFPAVMFVYMTSLAILVFAYIIYNRGFSRKGVTVDMLPPEWSEERKLEFVENGKLRLQKSKWLLIFIISLLFTFVAEAFALFVIPMLKSFFH